MDVNVIGKYGVTTIQMIDVDEANNASSKMVVEKPSKTIQVGDVFVLAMNTWIVKSVSGDVVNCYSPDIGLSENFSVCEVLKRI